jgi:hypothetical protein
MVSSKSRSGSVQALALAHCVMVLIGKREEAIRRKLIKGKLTARWGFTPAQLASRRNLDKV